MTSMDAGNSAQLPNEISLMLAASLSRLSSSSRSFLPQTANNAGDAISDSSDHTLYSPGLSQWHAYIDNIDDKMFYGMS